MPKLTLRILRSLLISLLVGVFPLLALWKNNLGQVANSALWDPLWFTTIFILIAFGLGLLISRSWEKAALFSILTSIFALLFGHLYNLVEGKTIFGFSIGFVKLFLVCFIVYLILVILVLRLKHVSNSVFLFGNIAAVCLILINLFPVLKYNIQLHQAAKPSETPPLATTTNGSAQPDIYYIVLDAYSRADVLQEVIGYDNSDFINSLESKGFYIPECPYSNYGGTLYTVMSVLNYDYLDELNVPTKKLVEYLGSNVNLILDNKVREVFHQYGYQFVTGRGYSSFNDINNSDVYLNYFKNSTGRDNLDSQRFSNLYLSTTVFRVLTELYANKPADFAWLPYWLSIDRNSDAYLKEASFWYYQNNYMFDELEKLPEKPGNYFVYAHINSPHAPYVFRADGSFRYPIDTKDLKVLNSDTLTYLNKRVLELVDTLQKKSDVPPIIIIQADHGLHVLTTGLDKHKILSAYYLPGELNTPPYATITPVNNFRLIIKDYFDPSMQLLPDTLWVKFTNDLEPVQASCDLNSK